MGIRTVSHGRVGGIRQSIRSTTAGRGDADVCQDARRGCSTTELLRRLSFKVYLFGASSLINQFPPSILEFVTSATFFLVGYLSFTTYRRMSPPPEKPFMDV